MNFTKLNVARRTTKSDGTVLEVLEDNTLRANFKDGTVRIKASDRKVTTASRWYESYFYTTHEGWIEKVDKVHGRMRDTEFEDGREIRSNPAYDRTESLTGTAPPKVPVAKTPPKRPRPPPPHTRRLEKEERERIVEFCEENE